MDNPNEIKKDSPKKRGRPKKSLIPIIEPKRIPRESENKKDIIVHIPISLSSVKEHQVISANKSTDDFEKKELISPVPNNFLLNAVVKKSEATESKSSKKDIFNRYMMNVNDNIYKKLNIEFIDNKTGKIINLENNKSACWWCTYEFKTFPCFITDNYYEEKFYIFGVFCSFNCAAAYNLNMNDYKINDRYSLMKILCKKIFESNIGPAPAPPKEILEKYGGYLTIEAYRNNFNVLNKEHTLVLPVFSQMVHSIEEKNIIDNNKYKVNSFKY